MGESRKGQRDRMEICIGIFEDKRSVECKLIRMLHLPGGTAVSAVRLVDERESEKEPAIGKDMKQSMDCCENGVGQKGKNRNQTQRMLTT